MCRLGVKTMQRFDFQFAPTDILQSYNALQDMQLSNKALSH